MKNLKFRLVLFINIIYLTVRFFLYLRKSSFNKSKLQFFLNSFIKMKMIFDSENLNDYYNHDDYVECSGICGLGYKTLSGQGTDGRFTDLLYRFEPILLTKHLSVYWYPPYYYWNYRIKWIETYISILEFLL